MFIRTPNWIKYLISSLTARMIEIQLDTFNQKYSDSQLKSKSHPITVKYLRANRHRFKKKLDNIRDIVVNSKTNSTQSTCDIFSNCQKRQISSESTRLFMATIPRSYESVELLLKLYQVPQTNSRGLFCGQ